MKVAAAANLIADVLTGRKDRWEIMREIESIRKKRNRRNLRAMIAGSLAGKIRKVWGPRTTMRKGVIE